MGSGRNLILRIHAEIHDPVVAGGPVGYWSTLPVKAMVQALKDQGVPASVSSSAGTYVCNHVFYGLMHFLASEGGRRRGGFIHVPYLPEQAARQSGQPSMGLETLARGLEIAVTAAIVNPTDSAAQNNLLASAIVPSLGAIATVAPNPHSDRPNTSSERAPSFSQCRS